MGTGGGVSEAWGVKGIAGNLVRGLKCPSWVILHVTDAPHRLDLRKQGSKLRALLKLSFLKQILVASVSWVLIAHPAVMEIKTRSEEKLLLYRRTCKVSETVLDVRSCQRYV